MTVKSIYFVVNATCKQTQDCWPTTANVVGCYVFCLFAHPVACCLQCVVGSCCTKFETGETFSYVQMDGTTPNNAGSCWPTMLCLFAQGLTL